MDLRDRGANLLVVPDSLAMHDISGRSKPNIAYDDAAAGENAGSVPGNILGKLAAAL